MNLSRVLLGCVLVLLPESPLALAQPKESPFDVLVLKNGTSVPGVILEETPTIVRFQYVRRKPGRLTTLFTTSFPRNDIDRIVALTPAQRTVLREQLQQIENATEIEKSRLDRVELARIDWNGKKDAGLRYESDYFVLISNAQEALVRRTAVRLEQITTAYTRFLPPRFPGGKPTTIVLIKTLDEYREVVKQHGASFENPAFYEPSTNRIVCGSDLAKLGDDLEKVHAWHREKYAEIDEQEAEYRRLAGNDKKLLARFLEPIHEAKQRIAQADRYNETLIDKATERLFAILYHEAFHSYASNFVYPCPPNNANTGDLPRWLNEGLAQIFESSIVEAGELRVGHADRKRLIRCRELLHKNELLTISELLKVGKREFIVGHDGRAEAERAYLTSWGLAFYLTFERRLLGTPAMDVYVQNLRRGMNPEKALSDLVGQPIDKVEMDFRRFMQQLQADGSLLEVKKN